MSQVTILEELSEQIAVRIRSCSINRHGGDWTESKRHRDYDLWIVTSGKIHIRTKYGEACAEEGDAVWFYPEFPYTAWTEGDGCTFIFTHFDFAVGDQSRILGDFPLSGVIPKRLIREEGALFHEAFQSVRSKANMSRMKLKGAFLILLSRIIECYDQGEYTGMFRAEERNSGQVTNSALLEPVFEYMKVNLHRPVRVHELAGVASMSEKYFISFFKKAIGVTPGQYMYHLKMNKARDYIFSDKYSVKEIAALLGYPDAYSFSKAFKKFYRIAPSRFRE